jgi:hypothetical protein
MIFKKEQKTSFSYLNNPNGEHSHVLLGNKTNLRGQNKTENTSSWVGLGEARWSFNSLKILPKGLIIWTLLPQ